MSKPLGYPSAFTAIVVQSITTPDGTWNFSYNQSTQTVTATAPADPLTNLQAQTTGTGGNGATETIKFYSGTVSGQPVRTVQRTFTVAGRVSGVTTTLEDGKASSISFGYEDSCTPRVNLKQEYDFNGSLIRATKIVYYTSTSDDTQICKQLSGTPTWTDTYMGQNQKYVLHITDIPQSITLYGAGGTTSTPLAQTNFTYDSTGLTTTSGTKSSSVLGLEIGGTSIHDDTDFGASMKLRGNPTVVSRMTTSGNFITTATNTYNILGELVSTKDGNGNQTQFDYTDSWANSSCISSPVFAYPTTVTNALNQLTESTYNSCDGTLATVADQNDINAGRTGTQYVYDGLQRITSEKRADGGATSICYGISSCYSGGLEPEVITTTTAAYPDPNQVSTVTLDGLGRELTSVGVDGFITSSAYDALGRLYTKSYPYASGSTPAKTTFNYDALSRPIFRKNPDGTSVQWCYEGVKAQSQQTNCQANKSANKTNESWVDYSDESSNHWQQISDGVGRLAAVMEPNSSGATALETDYTYDPMDDLTKVNQIGSSSLGEVARVRTFTYDGLSRLVCASNPEDTYAACPSSASSSPVQGTVWYTYDASSNVTTKTDARGIVINYSPSGAPIDALNRVVEKTYSDGTPTAHFAYDTSSATFPTTHNNFVGRLTQAWTTDSSNNVNVSTYKEPYSPVGRDGGFMRYSFYFVPTAQEHLYVYQSSWDQAGNLIADQNEGGAYTPSNTITLNGIQRNYSYDAAGRLSTISTNPLANGNAGATSYIFAANLTGTNPSYGPFGLTLANLSMSTGFQSPTMSMSRGYDTRGRLTSETDTNTAKQTLYSYTLHYTSNSNVLNSSDAIPGGSLMGAWTYGYDYVNRLANAQTTAGPFCCGTFTWAYDSFGNRKSQTVASIPQASMYASPTFTFSTATNRPDQWYWDMGGNLQYDNLYSYAYDGEGRLCATLNTNGTETQYVYDALGMRVAKGTSNTGDFNCNGPDGNGFTPTNNYIYGNDAEQMAEYDGNANLLHENVLLGSTALATFTQSTGAWIYSFNDWLGTRRVQVAANGSSNLTGFTSGPYGDGLSVASENASASEDHFTGKDRDVETGNDYFGARYYESVMGRFMSPDPSLLYYAAPTNPQSLNLYSYAQNNPVINTDPTGMYCDYSDHSDPSSGFDSSQFDFHSSSSECTQNGGQFVSDAYTHQDALGNSVDNDGRSNMAVSSSTDGMNVQLTGQFSMNVTMLQFTTAMQQSDFYISDLDQMLADKRISDHTGIQMRQDKTGCNVHVSVDANSGQNGQPVKGTYHKDIFNPNPNSNPADAFVTLPFHAVEAALDKQRTRDKIPGTIGDQFCP